MKRYIFLVFVFAIVFFCVSDVSAAISKEDWAFSVDLSTRVGINASDSECDQAVTRFAYSASDNINQDDAAPFYVSAFNEVRYNYDSARFQRIEIGVETGVKFLKFCHIGESIQFAFLEPQNDAFEAESILGLDFPLGEKFFDLPIDLYLFEEYTYSVTAGESTRNEVGAGFRYIKDEKLSFMLGWRHLDNIHDLDADQVECGVNYRF